MTYWTKRNVKINRFSFYEIDSVKLCPLIKSECSTEIFVLGYILLVISFWNDRVTVVVGPKWRRKLKLLIT